MLVANVSQFRKNLKHYIDSVAGNHDTLILNANGKSVVVISLEEYNSIEETEYLLSTPANKKMMYKALDEINNGKMVAKTNEELTQLLQKND